MNLSASLMCADAGHFAEEVAKLEAAGIDSFHIDIMDGLFVKNFALSWAEVGLFRRLTDLPLEVHLMVNDFGPHIEFAKKYQVEKVYLHCENPKAYDAYMELRDQGISAGIAINPGTSADTLSTFKNVLNDVLMMRVTPGFAGQSAINGVDDKVAGIQQVLEECQITVDGSVSKEVIESLSARGVIGFVLGTSALFNKSQKYATIVDSLRR